VKYAWIDSQRDHYSVTRLCRVLGVSRTGYCQWRGRAPSARVRANAILDAHVRQVHAGSRGSYGRPRIVQTLRRQGLSVGSERVRQSLRRQGLRPVYKRPYRVTTDSSHSLPVALNTLDRRFDNWLPNRAWVADLTYIATAEGWLYLAVIMDLASRRIVGWSMSERMKAGLVCEALRLAYGSRRPPDGLLLHSDRGSQGGFNRSSQHL
jgi:putative transposase